MTANQRLRARVPASFGVSMVAAVVAHALVFTLVPSWEVPIGQSQALSVEFVELIPLPAEDPTLEMDVEP